PRRMAGARRGAADPSGPGPPGRAGVRVGGTDSAVTPDGALTGADSRPHPHPHPSALGQAFPGPRTWEALNPATVAPCPRNPALLALSADALASPQPQKRVPNADPQPPI